MGKKGQFLLLTAFIMIIFFYFMAKWIEPRTIVDPSKLILKEEAFVFNNIKEKSFYFAANGTKSCSDLKYNIEEFQAFVEEYGLRKGVYLDFNYTMSPCYEEPPLFPVVVKVRLTLKSEDTFLQSNYSIEWVPPSP